MTHNTQTVEAENENKSQNVIQIEKQDTWDFFVCHPADQLHETHLCESFWRQFPLLPWFQTLVQKKNIIYTLVKQPLVRFNKYYLKNLFLIWLSKTLEFDIWFLSMCLDFSANALAQSHFPIDLLVAYSRLNNFNTHLRNELFWHNNIVLGIIMNLK